MAQTMAEMQAQLAKLMAENQALKAGRASSGPTRIEVHPTGNISVYIPGFRFPVNGHPLQWQAILKETARIQKAATDPSVLKLAEEHREAKREERKDPVRTTVAF